MKESWGGDLYLVCLLEEMNTLLLHLEFMHPSLFSLQELIRKSGFIAPFKQGWQTSEDLGLNLCPSLDFGKLHPPKIPKREGGKS